MKLQYLGDARDAFKWDILHWICTESDHSFSNLVFIPMLTPDGENPNEGNVHHSRFRCRDFIRPFIESLRQEPRFLNRITGLANVANAHKPQFATAIFAHDRYIGTGNLRNEYWEDFKPETCKNSIVFFDPDNGFEARTQNGTKWIRHDELKLCLSDLPDDSAIMVYQHRPRRIWGDLFAELKDKLDYADTAIAAYESDIAFVAITKNKMTGDRISKLINAYANDHLDVCFKKIK